MPSDTDVPSRSQIQPRYMDINDKDIASFVSALENQESEKRATLKERLLSNSPVVVYDWSEKTVEVRSKKNVG